MRVLSRLLHSHACRARPGRQRTERRSGAGPVRLGARAVGGGVRPCDGRCARARSGVGVAVSGYYPWSPRLRLTGASSLPRSEHVHQPDPGPTSRPRHRATAATCARRSSAWPCCPRWRPWSCTAVLLWRTDAQPGRPRRLAAAARGLGAGGSTPLAAELVVGLAVLVVRGRRGHDRPAALPAPAARARSPSRARTSQVLYSQAREDSRRDGLTGLGNQRAFQEELGRELLRPSAERGDRFASCSWTSTTSSSSTTTRAMPPATRCSSRWPRTMREVDPTRGPALPHRWRRVRDAPAGHRRRRRRVAMTERLLHFARRPTPACATQPLLGRHLRRAPLRTRPGACSTARRTRRSTGSSGTAVAPSRSSSPSATSCPTTLVDATRSAVQEVLIGRLLVAGLPAHRRPAHAAASSASRASSGPTRGPAARYRPSSSRPPRPPAAPSSWTWPASSRCWPRRAPSAPTGC